MYEPKLTQEELMDSSTFKRFLTSIDNILENLEDVDFTTMGKYLIDFQVDIFCFASQTCSLMILCNFYVFQQLMMMRYLRNYCLGNIS